MKFLFALLVIAATGWCGWYSYPGIRVRLEEKRGAKAREIAAAVKAVTGKEAGTTTTPDGKSATGAADLMAAFKSGKGEAAATETPAGQETTTSAPAATGSDMKPETVSTAPAVDDIDSRYPVPQFKTIEEITQEWSKIPSRAFPRKVKTLVSVNFEGPAGKTALPEKSEALAVGMTQGMLVLMKDKTDPARSLVPLANTDLKESMTALYEKYKAYKTQQVEQQRTRARALKARANGATDSELAAAGPKPKTEVGGVITAMLASLRAKEITETTEEKITGWGELNVEDFEGQSYWTGTIQCTVDNAIFGPTPTELLALIRDDKVVKWLYSGSKEPVQ